MARLPAAAPLVAATDLMPTTVGQTTAATTATHLVAATPALTIPIVSSNINSLPIPILSATLVQVADHLVEDLVLVATAVALVAVEASEEAVALEVEEAMVVAENPLYVSGYGLYRSQNTEYKQQT